MADGYEVAYIAGLFDGEGCVATYKRGSSGRSSDKGGWRAFAQVAMTDVRPLLRIQAIFGGRINRTSRRNLKSNHRPQWRWAVYSKAALEFFRCVHPYLSVKKDEAELAMALIEVTRPRGGRGRPAALSASEIATREELGTRIRLLKKGA